MGKRLAVLVAVDDPKHRAAIKQGIKKAKVRAAITFAAEAQEAIRLLAGVKNYRAAQQYPVAQVLIIDFLKRPLQAWEVLAWLHLRPLFMPSEVVMFSRDGRSEQLRRASELGVQWYIVIPPNRSELVLTIMLIAGTWPDLAQHRSCSGPGFVPTRSTEEGISAVKNLISLAAEEPQLNYP